MNCQKCETLNDADALFCKKCGNAFFSKQNDSKRKDKMFEILVFISITYWFAMDLINLLIRTFIGNWYESPFKYLETGSNLIYAAVPVLIALSIKTMGLKIPAIIFAALISCYILYSNIEWLFYSGIY